MHVHLVQRHHRGQHAGGVAGADQVAGGDQCAAGAAVDGRAHLGPFQVEAGAFHRGLGGGDVGLRLVGVGAALFVLFGGQRLQVGQALGARGLAAAQFGLGAGAGQLGLCARQFGTVAAGVDGEEHVALLHFLPFGVVDAVNVAGDARAQVDVFDGFHTAAELVPLADGLDRHRGHADLGRRGCALLGGLAAAAGQHGQGEDAESAQRKQALRARKGKEMRVHGGGLFGGEEKAAGEDAT